VSRSQRLLVRPAARRNQAVAQAVCRELLRSTRHIAGNSASTPVILARYVSTARLPAPMRSGGSGGLHVRSEPPGCMTHCRVRSDIPARLTVRPHQSIGVLVGRQGTTATPIPAATPTTPPASPAGIACYLPVRRPVAITSAAISAVATYRNQPGPVWYVFVVAFPTADVTALTAFIRQAYDSGDAVGISVAGMSVAGKLWQAPQPRRKLSALRAEQNQPAQRESSSPALPPASPVRLIAAAFRAPATPSAERETAQCK
jgi:hypothetical protein